jgi:hypothetical protein
MVAHNFVDEICQNCGVSQQLLLAFENAKENDVAMFLYKYNELESQVAHVNALIVEHSSVCDNGECGLEKNGLNKAFEDMRLQVANYKREIDALNARINEIENAETLDIQKINEFLADIENVREGSYMDACSLSSSFISMETAIKSLECHITAE